ncbi:MULTISPECIES: hypothetical protein [unclassified Avibacterium]|uniref:hypothetical protein n=1 Tax=unclassified Avibacterium TaxID=2685287 RepID=UPI002025DEC8|nr:MULTISPECIES: hypothetical protein [unclassified Avibacterium]MCW9699834.1 hypothetical protein [Avibacterium sp. 20-129]URL06450.1 hypothetical protein L4F92_10450 [Avibacterium sp. 21-595]
MIGFFIAFLAILLVIAFVIGVPLAVAYTGIISVKDQYELATNKRDKIHALCSPLTLATPFIYYHFINDSLWQALLSLLIIPTLVEAIWGKNGFINTRRK